MGDVKQSRTDVMDHRSKRPVRGPPPSNPCRPGIAPALGLRAGGDGLVSVAQTALVLGLEPPSQRSVARMPEATHLLPYSLPSQFTAAAQRAPHSVLPARSSGPRVVDDLFAHLGTGLPDEALFLDPTATDIGVKPSAPR